MKKVLITGAGTGFGYEVAMRLALKRFDVIAAVEIYAQVQTLKREAAERGVTLQVEKLDVTNEGDRKKALALEHRDPGEQRRGAGGRICSRHSGVKHAPRIRGQRDRTVAADTRDRQADGKARPGSNRVGVVSRGPEREPLHRDLFGI